MVKGVFLEAWAITGGTSNLCAIAVVNEYWRTETYSLYYIGTHLQCVPKGNLYYWGTIDLFVHIFCELQVSYFMYSIFMTGQRLGRGSSQLDVIGNENVLWKLYCSRYFEVIKMRWQQWQNYAHYTSHETCFSDEDKIMRNKRPSKF